MKNYRFSIVTVCKNSEESIERTICSVLNQNYTDIQYVIIDGGSSDKTVSYINQFRGKIDCLISEKDNGIYEAMNKGLSKADGDIVVFLNAGDIFFNSNVIWKINERINEFETENIDVFHGNVLMYYEKSGDGYMWKTGPLNEFKVYQGSIPHPSTYYVRKALLKNGIFDENYRIAGDYEWVVRGLVKNKLKFKYMNIITAIFYQGGISNSPGFDNHNREEIQKIISSYFTISKRIGYRILNRLRKILGL